MLGGEIGASASLHPTTESFAQQLHATTSTCMVFCTSIDLGGKRYIHIDLAIKIFNAWQFFLICR
jgi:hypothetical protein